jgi:hypothetical protein
VSTDKEFSLRIPDLQARPSEKTDQAVDQVVQTYQAAIAHLIDQLRDAGISKPAKVHAVYLLGQLRATAAVTPLLEQIDLKAEQVDPKGGIGRWGLYPAQEALARIGNPAVQMILDVLPREKDELRRKLMCHVLSDVEGTEFAKLLVQMRRDKETDAARKANLELALRVLASP